MPQPPTRPGKEQQLLRHARREGLLIMAVWAVVLPWGLVLLFSAWFCFGFMADDDLGRDPEEKGDGHA